MTEADSAPESSLYSNQAAVVRSMENSITPPRVARRGTATTRYEKELAGTPKLADDPDERKWVGPWLLGDTIGKGASGAWLPVASGIIWTYLIL